MPSETPTQESGQDDMSTNTSPSAIQLIVILTHAGQVSLAITVCPEKLSSLEELSKLAANSIYIAQQTSRDKHTSFSVIQVSLPGAIAAVLHFVQGAAFTDQSTGFQSVQGDILCT